MYNLEERTALINKLIAMIDEDIETHSKSKAANAKKQWYEEAAKSRDEEKFLIELKSLLVQYEQK